MPRLVSPHSPSAFQLPLSFLATFFGAANEIDNGSSRASSASSLKKRLHANCSMTPQAGACAGGVQCRQSTLSASGRPNEIPFVIKPRALDSTSTAFQWLHLRFIRTFLECVMCPALRTQRLFATYFAQKECYNKSP